MTSATSDASSAALRAVLDASDDAVLAEDAERIVIYANDAFGAMFLGGAPGSIALGSDCEASARQAAEAFVESSTWLEATERIVSERVPVERELWQLGTGRWVERDYLPRFSEGPGGAPVFHGHTWTYRDVTDRERLRQQVQDLAAELAVTSPPPSTFNEDRQAVDLAIERHAPTAVIVLVKFANLERINLQFGRTTGDAVLAAIPQRLAAALPRACIARLSGATFAIVPDDDTDPPLLARIVREAVGTITSAGAEAVLLRIATGAARGDAREGRMLLRRARLALDESLRLGHDVSYDDSLGERERRADELGLALPTALREGELSLVYQPVVRLADRGTVGHEALVRWERPGFGTITAASFVPVAEQMGMVGELDRWVLQRAVGDAKAALATFGGSLIGINASADTVNADGDFAAGLADAIDKAGISPASIAIELTETAAAAPGRQGLRTLHEISELGVRIAIDDFGVGASSLGLLRDVPFDFLKLDKSFTRGITDSRVRALITRSAAIAADFGAELIAEGVERETQSEALMECGVPVGQGWLLGMPQPLPVDERSA